MNDSELVRCFVREEASGREVAFSELVSRHVNWMYAASQRMVADPHAAEDVVQAAFIVLAKKAHRLPEDVRLTPWLLRVLQLAAHRVKRDVSRQRHHETRAFVSTPSRSQSSVEDQVHWKDIAPQLDAAVGKLGAIDREAILLRFYRQLSFAEVGAGLGLSEEAARKRVTRSLEKLRSLLKVSAASAMGVTALAELLMAHTAASAAPAGLIATATTVGLAKNAAVAGSAGAAAHGVLGVMALAQLKVAAVLSLLLLLMVGIGLAVVAEWIKTPPTTASLSTSRPAAGAPPKDANLAALGQAVLLSPHGQLRNGVLISYLGIGGGAPDGRPWHGPDGSVLAHAPFAYLHAFEGDQTGRVGHEFAFACRTQVSGSDWPATIQFPYETPATAASSDRVAAPAMPLDENNEQVPDRLGVNTWDKPGRLERFRFEIAAGAWTTRLASRPDRDTFILGGNEFTDTWFSRPTDVNGSATTFLTMNNVWHRLDQRIVAIDTDGHLFQTTQMESVRNTGMYCYWHLSVLHLPLERLSRFELQTRPFDQWIEFDNVSSDPVRGGPVVVRTSDDAGTLTADFSNGTSVTLLGVSDNTDVNKRWWGADGGNLSSVPYQSIPNRLGGPNAFELPVLFTGIDANGKPWSALNITWNSSSGKLGLAGRRDRGQMVGGEYILLGYRQAGEQTITLTIALAEHDYKTYLVFPVGGPLVGMTQKVPGYGEVRLSNPRNVDGHATITAQVPAPPPGMSVIVSAKSVGRVIPPLASPVLHDGQQHDFSFSAALQSAGASGGVDEFDLAIRDESRSVEFQNISLVPGTKSHATVSVHDAAGR